MTAVPAITAPRQRTCRSDERLGRWRAPPPVRECDKPTDSKRWSERRDGAKRTRDWKRRRESPRAVSNPRAEPKRAKRCDAAKRGSGMEAAPSRLMKKLAMRRLLRSIQ